MYNKSSQYNFSQTKTLLVPIIPNWNRIFVSCTSTKTLLNHLSKITIPIPNWNTTSIKRLILCIKVAYVWFNWIEETNTPDTRRKKHVLWLLHLLKCATAEVKKIVLQTLLYFIKRYVTFLQGIVIFFEDFFMVAKSTNHYKFTHAIIKNRCIIFTFNIFIYCVILVFELFFFLPHISLHCIFFLLIIDFSLQ